MNIMRPLTLATLASALAVPAIADTEQTLYLNPIIGYQLFDDKRDLSETGTYGIGVEFRFLPRWAMELAYNRADADRKYNPGSTDFEEIRVDGLYYFADQSKAWNPYLAVGAGHADFGAGPVNNAGNNHDETRVNVGGGVRYNVSDTISLRGDIREFHGIDESTFDTMASLGFSLAFGRTLSDPKPADADNDGVPDSHDQCPNTPPGASVDSRGCEIDSDGDGVVDSQDRCPNTPAGAEVDEHGCEVIVEAVEVIETIEVIELRVQFPNNSSVIDHTYDDEIRNVAAFMEEYPETSVEIAGHSDNTGEASYNQQLSQRRAEAVASRLTEVLGVDSSRVSSVGYGEAEPVADNSTAGGRAENRRVEARIQVRR